MRGSYVAEGWVECRCGKVVHQRHREETQELADARLKLSGVSLCHACEAEVGRKMDMCPESVTDGTSVAACRLGWAHTGRCEPWDLPGARELYDQLRAERKPEG